MMDRFSRIFIMVILQTTLSLSEEPITSSDGQSPHTQKVQLSTTEARDTGRLLDVSDSTEFEMNTFKTNINSNDSTFGADTSSHRGAIRTTDFSASDGFDNTETFNTTNIPSQQGENKSAGSTITNNDLHFVILDDSSGPSFIFHYILSPLVAIPGLVCNIFNIFALRKHGFEASTTFYLVTLSVTDLIFLVINLVTWSFSLLKMYRYPVYVTCLLAMRFNFITRGLQIAFGRISNVLVLVLSTERFIAVKFPFLVKFSPLVRYPFQITISIFVATLLIFIPAGFSEKYLPFRDTVTNTTKVIPTRSDIYKNNYDVFRVYSGVILIVFRLLPVCLVLIFNIGIIIVLRQSKNNSTKLSVVNNKRQQKQLKITRMLVAIATVFLICVTPPIVHSMITLNYPKYFAENINIWVFVQSLYPFLDILNSTINFFVYIVMSEKFRDIFIQYVFRRYTSMIDQ